MLLNSESGPLGQLITGGQIIKAVALWLKFPARIDQLGRLACRIGWIKDIPSRCLRVTSLILYILCQ